MSGFIAALMAAAITFSTYGEAKEIPPYSDRDVMCANLAYNAGYNSQGDYYKAKVQPYWKTRAIDIAYVDQRTVAELGKIASRMNITLAKAARSYYMLDCEGDGHERNH